MTQRVSQIFFKPTKAVIKNNKKKILINRLTAI